MQRFFLLLAVVFSTSLRAQDSVRSVATLNTATVYFGYGAELTHQSTVKAGMSTRFIVISGLSSSVDVQSLQISVPESVALLSHRYKVVYPDQNSTPVLLPEVRQMQDSIEIIMRDMARVDNQIAIEQETMVKTGTLIETALAGNGGKTILSDELLKLVNFSNNRISTAKTAIFNYNQANQASARKLELLRKRINSFNAARPAAARSYGELTLQVMCRQPGELPVGISYYTNNAGWTPLYDIRVNSKTNKVKLIYKASITQTSGIDWKKTRLTLSTGTPNFGVVAPVLTPWYLQLYVPGLYTDLQRRAQVGIQRNTIQSFDKSAAMEVMLEGRVPGLQVTTPLPKDDESIEPSTIQQYTTLNEGQLNTNFEIDLPYDIESDGELHQVTIRDEEISSILKNYAVPRLDKEAYLMAEVADWQSLDLLPGEANIIMDETYIGKSMIDPGTTADTLNLSLGRDKRVAVKRTLVKELSTLKTNGGYSRQVFTYELTVKNNKLTDVNLLLKDQYPLSNIKEVEVKLDESGEAMVNTETGALTWKIELKPGESRKVRFSYTIRYPKDKKIINIK
ncbi:MAG: mucoidy inhibitor MuiA family protein [Chitinophagaceae bacterium]|nr:MAG: mucoidy inhibitor MuiA family protein [Chitinophagaceae bacterium]